MKKNKQGFSLLELIITMAIFSLISLVLVVIFIQTYETFYIQENQTQLQVETRYSLDTINNWVKKASSVISSYTPPGETAYETSDSVIILQVAAIDEDQNIIADTYDYLIFQADPSNPSELQQIIYADESSDRTTGTRTIAHYLNSLSFSYFDSSNNQLIENFENSVFVTIELNSEEVVRGKTNKANFKTQTKLRNK